jgi:hypothetical protein
VAADDLLKTHPHLKEFLPYLDLLNKESDRGKVLVSTGFLVAGPHWVVRGEC